MLKAVDVWKRIDDSTAVCYRCFEVLDNRGFCVQSKDTFHLPIDAQQFDRSQRQELELLCEESPESRSGVFPTLLDAIRAFDEDFEETFPAVKPMRAKTVAINNQALPKRIQPAKK